MIGASIYQQIGRGVKSVEDYDAERLRNQLGALELRNNQLAIGAQEQKQAQQAQLLNLLQSGANPEALLRGGNIDAYTTLAQSAAKVAQDRAQAAKFNAEREANEFKKKRETLKTIYDFTTTAVDQPSYERALRGLAQMGIDLSDVPTQYDPAFVAQSAKLAMDQKERIEAEAKQRGLDIQESHYKAREGLMARGQNMTNARMRSGSSGSASFGGAMQGGTIQVDQQGNMVVVPRRFVPGVPITATPVLDASGKPLQGSKGKSFSNESKLRNDFKSEPIYQDYQDMRSSYAQIKAGLAQGTPIGDTAAATKIMKLLDPGSVVRESELGIAMAATGRMDRLANFVQMQVSGEKLTPSQRIEFGALADELMAAVTQGYNAKRAEYEEFGEGHGLNPSVLGAPGQMPAGKDKAKGKVKFIGFE